MTNPPTVLTVVQLATEQRPGGGLVVVQMGGMGDQGLPGEPSGQDPVHVAA